MSFYSLRYLLWLFFSLFIMGGLSAECVDLSGSYICRRSSSTQVSQTVNDRGVAVYQFVLGDGITFQYVANGSRDVFGNISVCDQGRLRVYNRTSTPPLVVDYESDGRGTVLNISSYYTAKETLHPFDISDRDLTRIPGSTYSCNRI